MHSFTHILIHAVFSTKYRNAIITDEIRDEMHKYMGGVLRNLGCGAIVINSVEDHVHLLFWLSSTQTISFVMQELKRATSEWVTKRFSLFDFRWQNGYCALSVDEYGIEKVKNYIYDQRAHHIDISFSDELREIFRQNGMEFNEQEAMD